MTLIISSDDLSVPASAILGDIHNAAGAVRCSNGILLPAMDCLSRENPSTAPSYSERRSGLAKQLGLGRGRTVSPQEVSRGNRMPDNTATAFTATGRIDLNGSESVCLC